MLGLTDMLRKISESRGVPWQAGVNYEFAFSSLLLARYALMVAGRDSSRKRFNILQKVYYY